MSDRNRISIRLGDSDRDNVIKAWLDIVRKDPKINVSEIVKDHLYQVATSSPSPDETQMIIDVIRAEFAKLPSMIKVTGGAAAAIEETPESDAEEIKRRIGSMPD